MLSIATPVAGVVGFALQLRHVKKAQLENEKLQLEIAALKEKLAQSDQRIVKPTNEEIMFVNRNRTRPSHTGNMFESRRASGEIGAELQYSAPRPSVKERLTVAAFIGGFVLFVAYFLYDIYRLLVWLSSQT